MLKNIFLSEKKLLNAILRAKLKYMKNVSSSKKWHSFLQCRRRFHECLSFFCRKSHLELKCTNHFFRASKNTNSVFSATKQIIECWGHRCSKTSFSVRKVTKCNFKSKLKYMKNVFFLMKWTVFCNAEDRFSWVELFCRKSHFRA